MQADVLVFHHNATGLEPALNIEVLGQVVRRRFEPLAKFRFLAAAYGRINSTWTLPNQVGWPIAKELLFTARIVGGEEAYRIGLLNHLWPKEQLREKTMEMAKLIANNHLGAVMGVKALMLEQKTMSQEQQFDAEKHYTTHVMRGAKAKDAFPDFMERKNLKVDGTR